MTAHDRSYSSGFLANTHTVEVPFAFSAGHMVIIAGECEPLHGHNYTGRVEVCGRLGADRMVIDFHRLCALMREVCFELDHHILLPQRSAHITLREEEGEVWVTTTHRRYLFPARDICALPVSAVSTEELAAYITGRLIDELEEYPNIQAVTVTLYEMDQVGSRYTEKIGGK